jgi:putative Holliday junction resolvase
MSTPRRILALDLGTKRIGIAVSDPLGWTAQGLETLTRRSPESDREKILGWVKDYDVGEVLVGLPLTLKGEEGESARQVRKFVQYLAEKLDRPIRFWDERLSTVAAERVLLEGDLSREKRRLVIDKVAAVIILQGYLDSLIPPESTGEGSS